MAIKALMLRKKIELRQKEFAKLAEARANLEKREAEAEKAIEEVENDEQMAAVQETVDALKEERTKLEADESGLNDQIRQLEKELEETEKEVEVEPDPAPQPEPEVREKKKEEKKNDGGNNKPDEGSIQYGRYMGTDKRNSRPDHKRNRSIGSLLGGGRKEAAHRSHGVCEI